MPSFNPLNILKFHKRAWHAGAMALARNHSSGWHMESPAAPTMAQEATARNVVDAAFRECRVGDLHRLLTAVVESSVRLKGDKDTEWIHVKKAPLEEARLLLETINASD